MVPTPGRKNRTPVEAPKTKRSIKRMKSKCAAIEEQLRDVYTLAENTELVRQGSTNTSNITIDDDDLGVLLFWEENNLYAFVAAMNQIGFANPPHWLVTRPASVQSFTHDVVTVLAGQAGGRVGRILLMPNTIAQSYAVVSLLSWLQGEELLQDAAQAALPQGQLLARVMCLTETRVQNAPDVENEDGDMVAFVVSLLAKLSSPPAKATPEDAAVDEELADVGGALSIKDKSKKSKKSKEVAKQESLD
ncbi:Aste57867_2566 [Aphanomyces stellatus]|uniref:Aste57867_2566 protein n=1 Tax=Aphanomyces stellatus TaxID=120398 RepID=A0A485KAC9_9STRA|nr:hypothetical protein As57867_002559 [Aphanomyces stellatus]VFT79762.1 Aste57867_2566 [Aphanomyces stellatus]